MDNYAEYSETNSQSINAKRIFFDVRYTKLVSLMVLVLGFFLPVFWVGGFLFYRDPFDKYTRYFGITSVILFLIVAGLGTLLLCAFLLILFLVILTIFIFHFL